MMTEVEKVLVDAGWGYISAKDLKSGMKVYGHLHGEGKVGYDPSVGLFLDRGVGREIYRIKPAESWLAEPRESLTLEDFKANPWRIALDRDGDEWWWTGSVLGTVVCSADSLENVFEASKPLVWADGEVG